ncbi:hypothetical protein LSTR_LSTR004057 [Laodelphax striatellus]|uniref:Uncharacterized protein n=1 Tax=Laodelphax striatellus TaxID=195883 RepID=A0A482WFC1_LAOST|nr:hypothetical protein LSTR_LSTR004057 [Laodelphax striatellus]
MPKESHKFCKDMMGVLQQSGKDSFSAVVDTVKAAGSAVGFCAVECLKIFEKAIKSVITLNFKELANQVVKFGECFLDCVKQVLNIFKVGFQGANKLWMMSGGY